MNKKISKTVLALVMGAMIATSIYIGIQSKSDYKVVDIQGSRDALDNVSFIYQEKQGMYKTKEVSISKDSVELNNNAKELRGELPLTKQMKDNRDVLKYTYSRESIYSDDQSIGHIVVNEIYETNENKKNLTAYIEDKNLKNNEIKSYDISLAGKFEEDISINHNAIPIKYKNELYLVMGIDIDPGYINEQDKGIYASKECLINVYKLNLENETSKLISSKKIGGKEDLSSMNSIIAFSNENNVYFIKENYEEIKNNKVEKIYNLVKYDIKENKISTIELPVYSEKAEYLNSYSIQDNKVTFISQNYKGKDEVDIYTTTVNLDNDTVVNSKEKYTIKVADSNFNYGVRNTESINGKLYLCVSGNEISKNNQDANTISKDYIYVIDEKTKKTLYTGKIKEGKYNYISPTIVKESEI